MIVKADNVTDLASSDVFYFGNSVGESGNSATNTFVDGTDFAGARDNPHNFSDRAAVTDAYDYNRDSFVDGMDLALVRDNPMNFLTALKLFTVPGAAPSAAPLGPAAGPAMKGAEGESGGQGEGLAMLPVAPGEKWYLGAALDVPYGLDLPHVERALSRTDNGRGPSSLAAKDSRGSTGWRARTWKPEGTELNAATAAQLEAILDDLAAAVAGELHGVG